jgi:hypothetical protein
VQKADGPADPTSPLAPSGRLTVLVRGRWSSGASGGRSGRNPGLFPRPLAQGTMAHEWSPSGASSARADRNASSAGSRHGNRPPRRGIAIAVTAAASGDPERVDLTSARSSPRQVPVAAGTRLARSPCVATRRPDRGTRSGRSGEGGGNHRRRTHIAPWCRRRHHR